MAIPNNELDTYIQTGNPPPVGYKIPIEGGGKISFNKLKKSKEFGGGVPGSGAGAKNTAINESAQCVYNQALWDNPNTDFSDGDIKAAYKNVKVNVSIDDILKIGEDWKQSSKSTANVLHKSLKNKKYEWHRGDGFQTKIEAKFRHVNNRSFSNINKWNPADIWAVSVNPVNKYNFDVDSLEDLNLELLKAYSARDIIGVSLKKIKTVPKVQQVNYKRPFHEPVFTGLTLGKRSYWQSKDGYIFYEGGQIQFRTFPSFQCEVIGRFSKHGKITGSDGPKSVMGKIMEQAGAEPLDTQRSVMNRFREQKKALLDTWFSIYCLTDEETLSYDEFISNINEKDKNWCVSKFLVTQTFKNIRGFEQRFLSGLLRYAKSESEKSSVHLKVK